MRSWVLQNPDGKLVKSAYISEIISPLTKTGKFYSLSVRTRYSSSCDWYNTLRGAKMSFARNFAQEGYKNIWKLEI